MRFRLQLQVIGEEKEDVEDIYKKIVITEENGEDKEKIIDIWGRRPKTLE